MRAPIWYPAYAYPTMPSYPYYGYYYYDPFTGYYVWQW